MGNYFNELRLKIIKANNLLQFIHQVTIEFRFRKSLAQERFKSNLESLCYGDLVCKFKRIVGNPNLSDQIQKIIKRYKRVGYSLDIITRQSACMVVIPIKVYSYGFLFNYTTVGQASGSMTALFGGLVPDGCLWLGPPWLNVRFSLALTKMRLGLPVA